MHTEKVLIVDDEKLVRWSLRQKCEEWGYHVLEAHDPAAAIEMSRLIDTANATRARDEAGEGSDEGSDEGSKDGDEK